MKILHIKSGGKYGGVETVLKSLLPSLKAQGFECGLINIYRPGEDVPQLISQLQPYVKVWGVEDHSKFDFAVFFKIYSIIKRFEPNIIHSHGYKSDIIALLMKNLLNKKIVSTVHGYTKSSFAVRIYEWIDRLILRYFDAIVNVMPVYDNSNGRSLSKRNIVSIPNGINIESMGEQSLYKTEEMYENLLDSIDSFKI